MKINVSLKNKKHKLYITFAFLLVVGTVALGAMSTTIYLNTKALSISQAMDVIRVPKVILGNEVDTNVANGKNPGDNGYDYSLNPKANTRATGIMEYYFVAHGVETGVDNNSSYADLILGEVVQPMTIPIRVENIDLGLTYTQVGLEVSSIYDTNSASLPLLNGKVSFELKCYQRVTNTPCVAVAPKTTTIKGTVEFVGAIANATNPAAVTINPSSLILSSYGSGHTHLLPVGKVNLVLTITDGWSMNTQPGSYKSVGPISVVVVYN